MPERSARRAIDNEADQPAKRGRPSGDHQAKRAELLDAAASVVAEEGYAHASLRKVAHRAGGTTGTVTYYFANKEELITALVESRFDEYDAMLDASRDAADIRAVFESWVARISDDSESWLVMFQLLAHARHEPALAAVIERRYARFRDLYASILAAGQRRGTIRDDIPADLLADQLSAIGDGWMMMYPIEPDRFTPTRLKTLIDTAIALITPVGRPRRTPAS
jgi:AcrR family transcriptional regulator